MTGTRVSVGDQVELHLDEGGALLVLSAPLQYDAKRGEYSVTWLRPKDPKALLARVVSIVHDGDEVLTISGCRVASKASGWSVAPGDSLRLVWPGPIRARPRVRDGIHGHDGYRIEPSSLQADEEPTT